MVHDVPFSFDPDFYRRNYPEFSTLSDSEAEHHYRQHGVSEGRQGSPVGSRSGFTELIGDAGRVLEIGPFCNPIARGPHVEYLDVLTSDELRERAVELNLDPAGCPEHIHHTGDISEVNGSFDAVVSSHSIEHQPNFIKHIQHIERLLKVGGRYMLFIPDKRYCFDHFNPISTIADILDAHQRRPTAHSLKSIVEHRSLITHNDAARHWIGDHGEITTAHIIDKAKEALCEYASSEGRYIDVHTWYFTPKSFYQLVDVLFGLELIKLRVSQIYPTLRNTLEFFAVLERV
jgi:SAM-dependent methyltransferase